MAVAQPWKNHLITTAFDTVLFVRRSSPLTAYRLTIFVSEAVVEGKVYTSAFSASLKPDAVFPYDGFAAEYQSSKQIVYT